MSWAPAKVRRADASPPPLAGAEASDPAGSPVATTAGPAPRPLPPRVRRSAGPAPEPEPPRVSEIGPPPLPRLAGALVAEPSTPLGAPLEATPLAVTTSRLCI